MDASREQFNFSKSMPKHVDPNESAYDSVYKVRRKRKDVSSTEQRKSYPMRRRTLDSSSSSQVVDDDSTDHEQPKRPKVTFSSLSANDTTQSSIDQDRRLESEVRSVEQKSDSDEDPNAGNRLWRLELSRADMEKFSDIESKLFRRLLKKILKNNGSAFTSVTAQQAAAEAAALAAASKEEPPSDKKHVKSSKSHGAAASPAKRVKRKRKVITRKDKNGVIIEKIYKPFEGEEEKGDIIVKYVNGQPVGTVNSLDVEESQVNEKEKQVKIELDQEMLPNHDENTVAKEQDSPLAASNNENLAPMSLSANVENEPGKVSGTSLDTCETMDPVGAEVIPSSETVSRHEDGSFDIVQSSGQKLDQPVDPISGQINVTNIESVTDNKVMPLDSNEAEVKTSQTFSEEHIEKAIVTNLVESKEPTISEQQDFVKPVKVKRKPMVSARTKLTANRKERGPLIDFDYFQSSAGGSSSCKLLQYLMFCQKEKSSNNETSSQEDTGGYLDPYDCLSVIESVLKKKPYRDELSSSSDEENGGHEAEKKHEPSSLAEKSDLNQTRSGARNSTKQSGLEQKSGETGAESTIDTSKVTANTGKKMDSKKTKGKKSKKKRSNFDPGLASDDEKDRNIVEKLVKKFKVEKDDDDKSGVASRATLKLTHPVSEMLNEQSEKDFNFEITYPVGAERSSHVLQSELSNNYFSNPISADLCARIVELEINLNCCIDCSEAATKDKEILYGPYNFKKEVLDETQEQSGTSDVLSVWIHEECALSSPNVCLVGPRLLGLQELVEARLDPDYKAVASPKEEEQLDIKEEPSLQSDQPELIDVS